MQTEAELKMIKYADFLKKVSKELHEMSLEMELSLKEEIKVEPKEKKNESE